MPILTQWDAEKFILNHYGLHLQEVQAVQELSELILLLAARPDQRAADYKAHITEEIADCIIMMHQIMIAHGITEQDVSEMKSYKLRRQLARIEKEDEEE